MRKVADLPNTTQKKWSLILNRLDKYASEVIQDIMVDDECVGSFAHIRGGFQINIKATETKWFPTYTAAILAVDERINSLTKD